MAIKTIALELHTIGGGQLCVNVLHFKADVAETDNFLLARRLVLAFDETTTNAGFSATKYMIPQSNQAFLSSVVARVVSVPGQPKFPKLYASGDYPGEEGEAIYSQQLACNIKLVTASGPDYTGRIFLPNVPEDRLEINRWTSAYEALIATLRSDLVAPIETSDGDWELCVFKASDRTSELVTNTMLVPNPGTIRSRLAPV